MRLFIYPIIFTIALLFVFAEIAFPIVHKEKAIHTLPIHKTLYLDREIYDEEMFHILEATIEWNEVTNGQVSFDIKKLPQQNILSPDSIVFNNVTSDYPEIIILDAAKGLKTLGFFNDTFGLAHIALVDTRIGEAEYTAVVLHELGHALGLDHIEGIEGLGTLMYPTIDSGSSHITTTDMFFFCKKYHCDYKQFKAEPSLMDIMLEIDKDRVLKFK